MVAKISLGNSLFGALSYNHEKVNEDLAKVLYSSRIMQTDDGSYNIPLCSRSFEPYLMANNKTENPVMHISLNPHPDDVLTDEQFVNIARKYMDRLGYGNQPYMVYKHEDIDRHHLHIVTVCVKENGERIKNSYEHKRSKEITSDLEKEYNLLPAGKKHYAEEPTLRRVNPKEGDIKKQVSNTAKSLLKSYCFQSVNEYRALLSFYGITVDEIKGEVRGKSYNGLVYSVINKKGDKVGNPFKASLMGKVVGYEVLQKRIAYSQKSMKAQPPYDRTKEIVASLLSDNPNRENFEKALAKNKISVLFRENENGRIYGVTFIDHEEKVVFNGSKMGKEFSANAFNELFNNNDFHKHSLEDSHLENTPDSYEAVLEGVAGIFSMEQHGDNYEEMQFAKRMNRKKKGNKRKL